MSNSLKNKLDYFGGLPTLSDKTEFSNGLPNDTHKPWMEFIKQIFKTLT
jgi:hypothetical protein